MSRLILAQRRTWALFLAGSAVLIVAMAALSVAILRADAHAIVASAEKAHAQRLRDAAAEMDRWLGPVLAREAGRHYSDYASYRAPRRAFSATLERLPPGSVLEPSPLLGSSADTLLLHFEWSPAGGTRSPEAPQGKERELALASGLPPETLRVAEERLESVLAQIDLPELARSVREEAPAPGLDEPPAAVAVGEPSADTAITQSSCLSPDELREGPSDAGLVEDAGGASVGPLVARWLTGGGLAVTGGGLVFARDVRVGARSSLQVIVADWPALSKLLLERDARDLAGARLMPGRLDSGAALATLPATLVADKEPPPAAAWTPQATRLALGWLAGLVALGALGAALRMSLDHAERRARFAAAVSHELRTPLTTLRLYSELLADGVISDPAIRQEYLETIQAESARLASLVENVLLHARIEQTSQGRRRMSVGALVESVLPVLRRRADEADRPLVIELEPELDKALEVEVDRDAVERVLFNLVDNACKHGALAEDKTLRLEVRRRASHVDLQVRDSGPGIPRALGNAVFEAFRRGEDTSAPGAGLGLALSRSLARELRGELSLVPSDRGACFRLSLRLA